MDRGRSAAFLDRFSAVSDEPVEKAADRLSEIQGLGSTTATAWDRAHRPMDPKCPACGQPLADPPPSRCPLCDVSLSEGEASHVDVTPYAVTFETDRAGWRRMIAWVWNARWQRLKHIALMRRSPASGHFAQVNTLLLAAGLALVQGTMRGWHEVGTGPAKPDGAGWFHTVGNLWWNPAQAIIAVAVAFATAWLVMTLVRLLIRNGAAALHRPPNRAEQRMTAAIDYSTAFALPVVIGSAALAFRVLSVIGSAGRWTLYPPTGSLEVIAGIVAGLGVVLWWFWLIRLGAAAPERSRRVVMTFLGVGAPLIVAAAAVAWWFALENLWAPLFERLGMSF